MRGGFLFGPGLAGAVQVVAELRQGHRIAGQCQRADYVGLRDAAGGALVDLVEQRADGGGSGGFADGLADQAGRFC